MSTKNDWSETAMGNRHNNLPPLRERLAQTAADERRERNWSRTTRAIGEYCDQRDASYESRDVAWESLVTLRVVLGTLCLGLGIALLVLAFAGCTLDAACTIESAPSAPVTPDAAPADAAPIDCAADCLACHSSDFCFPADAAPATVPDASPSDEADASGPACGKVGLPCCTIFNPDGAPLPWCGSGTPVDVDGACACVSASAEEMP